MDNDGISNFGDNCPHIAPEIWLTPTETSFGNPCDPDDDNDLHPDERQRLCETHSRTTSIATASDECDHDDDDDGFNDDIDLCPLLANVAQRDFDGDGGDVR